MCRAERKGFLPSSALSNSNPIKVLLPWGLAVLPRVRPTAHLKSSPAQNNCPPRSHLYSYADTRFSTLSKKWCVCVWPPELTSNHHPAVGSHYYNPPGARPHPSTLAEPSMLRSGNQSARTKGSARSCGVRSYLMARIHCLHILILAHRSDACAALSRWRWWLGEGGGS